MNAKHLRSLAIILFICMLAGLLAWAGSDGGGMHEVMERQVPVIVVCAVLAFAIQWLAFVPAFIFQTEHFYDLVGSITYLSVLAIAAYLGEGEGIRSTIIMTLIAIWALRLGSFLFVRISKDGADSRFEQIKPNFLRFLTAWTLQGLWVFVTISCALAALTANKAVPLGLTGILGILLWVSGFCIECVADHQKRVFRRENKGQGAFIRTGLWAYSRHPNYLGEILLWIGIAVLALPALSGWQYATLISPVFVILLLTKVSGIPLLEASADKRWQGEPDYEHYKSSTPVLVPRLF